MIIPVDKDVDAARAWLKNEMETWRRDIADAGIKVAPADTDAPNSVRQVFVSQASTDGIGFYISKAQQSFDYVGMWSGIIVLAIIGTVANLLFVVAENRVLHWHYGARAVEGSK